MKEIGNEQNIDWDFTHAKTNGLTHSIHSYPAKYIPQIPRAMIEEFSEIGETIYDPFVGSGTTCVEANALGRNAIGNDVNELAVLISKVKTTPINILKLNNIDYRLDILRSKVSDLYKRKNPIHVKKPEIINLELWFKEFVIDEIVTIKDEINNIDDEDIKDFCLVALSAILVNVSNQDSDTRYVRVIKNIHPGDTLNKFILQIRKMRRIMERSHDAIIRGVTSVKVADTRSNNIFKEDSADFSVTSPPYPNAWDYHLYHKYRLFWLDMDPYELRRNEIGSHADYSKKNGLTKFDFEKDMEHCFSSISKILKKGKYFSVVIGNSIIKGEKIENNEILKKLSKKTSLKFVKEFSRNVNLNRKSFNPKIGNIKTEKIMIFQNLK